MPSTKPDLTCSKCHKNFIEIIKKDTELSPQKIPKYKILKSEKNKIREEAQNHRIIEKTVRMSNSSPYVQDVLMEIFPQVFQRASINRIRTIRNILNTLNILETDDSNESGPTDEIYIKNLDKKFFKDLQKKKNFKQKNENLDEKNENLEEKNENLEEKKNFKEENKIFIEENKIFKEKTKKFEEINENFEKKKIFEEKISFGEKKNFEENCPICTENFEQEDLVISLECEHVFHEYCILPWLNLNNSCPNCRFAFPRKNSV